MASGRVHATATLLLAPLVAGAAWHWFGPEAALDAGLGYLVTLAVNPDLDQEGMSSVEADILRYTAGFGAPWLGLWFPYAMAVRHRRSFSHFPLIGTVGRLLYLAAYAPVFLGVHLLLASLVPWITVDWPPVSALWTALGTVAWVRVLRAAAGMAVSDAVHWVMDGCPV